MSASVTQQLEHPTGKGVVPRASSLGEGRGGGMGGGREEREGFPLFSSFLSFPLEKAAGLSLKGGGTFTGK